MTLPSSLSGPAAVADAVIGMASTPGLDNA
jgi:hypothetical protein